MDRPASTLPARIWLARIQGAYFALTGAWGLVDLSSFQWVTGPKTDLWLVRAVSVLVLALGAVLLLAAARLFVDAHLALLAMASAAGLAAVETYYALSGAIRAIYLADAALEALFVLGWAVALWRGRDEPALWAGAPRAH